MTRRTATRVLFALAAVGAALTIVLAVIGGFSTRLAGIRISARGALRPLLFTLLTGSLAVRLLSQAERQRLLERTARAGTTLAPWLAAATAAVTLGIALAHGTRSAGGADSYGYLSQARLWLAGDLHVHEAVAGAARWPDAEWTFSPLGYRPAGNQTIVPTYAPGLPLLMAAFTKIGGNCGPFVVTPLCAAFLVGLTYLLGVRLSGRATGLMAALILAASPTFVFMSLSSMSDIPAAAFWTAALVVACGRPTILAAGLAGTASGIAITIRPNLAPLAIFPAMLLVLAAPQHRVRRAASFAAGCVPFVLFVAGVNRSLYGSAMRSGYGDLESLFKPAYAGANLSRFLRWLWQTQGPLVFIGVLAPIVWWRRRQAVDGQTRAPTAARLVLLLYVGGVFGCYLLYTPFDAWWFLRFILPAFPALFALAADAVWVGSQPFRARFRVVVPLVFTLVCVDWGVRFCRTQSVLEFGDAEQKYADVGRFIASELPPNAAVITLLHSGSVRYYSGRTTLRYEWLDPQGLDRAVTYLKSNGLETYAVLETSELAEFREKFKGQLAAAALDRPALATHARGVYVYAIDPARVTDVPRAIPRTSGCE